MSKTWKATIRYSLGGSSKAGQFTNVLHFSSANAIDSDAIKAELMPLVTGIQNEILSQCTIVSITISDPAKRTAGYDPTLVRTIGLGLAGRKGVQGPSAIKQVVQRYVGDTGSGRGAHLSLRMASLESEISAGADGNPSGNPTGAADLAGALNGAITGGLVLHAYSHRKNGQVTDVPVKSYSYVGVGYRTATRRRKRGQAKTVSGLQDKLKSSVEEFLQTAANITTLSTALNTPAGRALSTAVQSALPAVEALPELAAAL